MQGKFVKPIVAATLGALIGALAIASCTTPAPERAPTPPPKPAPILAKPVQPPVAPPAPPVQLAPSYAKLMDAPISAGDWFYDTASSENLAIFGADINRAELFFRCDPATKRVGIARKSDATAPVAMLIRTETAQRQIEAVPMGGERALVTADFAADDPLLTRLAFSNGRFGIEVAGEPAIYPPAWPEITRILEDCR